MVSAPVINEPTNLEENSLSPPALPPPSSLLPPPSSPSSLPPPPPAASILLLFTREKVWVCVTLYVCSLIQTYYRPIKLHHWHCHDVILLRAQFSIVTIHREVFQVRGSTALAEFNDTLCFCVINLEQLAMTWKGSLFLGKVGGRWQLCSTTGVMWARVGHVSFLIVHLDALLWPQICHSFVNQLP